MLVSILKTLYQRDLKKLSTEIESYRTEKMLWVVDKQISNSGGNLCLHILGNLNHFIGAQIGATGYKRERELEFSAKNVAREKLLSGINELSRVIEVSLDPLTDEQLETTYPLAVFGHKMTTGFFLVHLATHLTYHLGQINYHRRLVDTA